MMNTSSSGQTFHINISYDSNALENSEDIWMLVSYGICIPILAVIGFIGNVLTGFVLWNKEIKSTSIYFLRTLVISDIALLLTGVMGLSLLPIAQIVPAMQGYIDVIYPRIFTPTNYLLMTLQMINVWITVAVTFERFIAVRFPLRSLKLRSKRNSLVSVAVICIVSVFYNMPRCFATKTINCSQEYEDCYFLIPTEFGQAAFYQNFYSSWMYLIFIYAFPVFLLVVLNSLLIIELSKIRSRRCHLVAHEVQKNEHNVSVTLALIVTVFIMCQTPGLIAQFDFLESTELLKFVCVSNTFFIFNSAVNFVMYVAVGKKFRSVFIQMFTLKRQRVYTTTSSV